MSSDVVRIAGVMNDSIVDGPGIRVSIFAQGCSHGCVGCHNPQTHDFSGGIDISCAELIAQIRKNPLASGITFSGGDPFFQPEAFCTLAGKIRQESKKYEIAAYTGFTWEYLVAFGNEHQRNLLKELDILVDGPFMQEYLNLDLPFRGSSNQRIIDVPASLKDVVWGETPVKEPVLCTTRRWNGGRK